MSKKFLKITFLSVLGLLFVSGCSLSALMPGKKISKTPEPIVGQGPASETTGVLSETIEQALAKQSQVKKFSSYENLAMFLKENPVSNGYNGGGIRSLMAPVGMGSGAMMKSEITMDFTQEAGSLGLATPTAAPPSPTTAGMDGASDDYSETNNQVKGVDESDIIKTDGKYIYTLSRNSVFIVAAYPADEAEILAKIEFKSRPADIFINGDRLVVFGSDDLIYKTEMYSRFRRQSAYTFLKIFDISDRKNPKQIRDLDFEGNYQNSRLIGDNIYFITNNYNYYYVATEPVIPRLLEDGAVLSEKCESEAKCFAPSVYYFDLPYSAYNFTTISVVNIKDENKKINGEVYLLSGGQNMYVSQNNLYITYTKYVSEYQLEMAVFKEMIFPRLAESDQKVISEIDAVKNYILTPDEKAQKINMIIERYVASLTQEEQKKIQEELLAGMKKKYADISKELEKTIIHKIAIKGDSVEYQATGEVTGNVLNQFSMDENDGYFRIATTKNRTWLPYYFGDTVATDAEKARLDSYSNIYVLDGGLKVVGKIENIEPGERIYSVRFMQNRAYLVTFQQTDPLFVIDLSNPKNPKILGSLKMPGYSSYLHPYNDKLLIGLGKNTVANSWGGVTTKGLKISLYDVSDVAKPKEVDTYNFTDETSNSIALNDHKAFLFSLEKNLLVIPYTANSSDVIVEPMPVAEKVSAYRPIYREFFSGAAVFKVTEKGFELKGKIGHPKISADSAQDCWWGYCYYNNNVLRSLFISDTLYTFSSGYLKANNISDLKEIKNLELKKEKAGQPSDIEIIN